MNDIGYKPDILKAKLLLNAVWNKVMAVHNV